MRLTLMDRLACLINKRAIKQHLLKIASEKHPDRDVTDHRRYVRAVWGNTSEELPYRTDRLPLTRQHALHDWLMESR